MSLRWTTEDETDLDVAPKPESARPERPRRRWLMPLLVVMLAFGLLYVGQRQRLRAQEASLAAEIQASYRLWEEAALAGDAELFSSLLVGSNQRWRKTQEQLLENGRLLGREMFGLTTTRPLTATVVAVDLEADWRAAEVTTERQYRGRGAAGEPVAVRLQQPLRFVRSGFSWLLAPLPAESYWGAETEVSGERITMLTPSRDDALARRLLADLERDLAAWCATQEGSETPCPADLRVYIRLLTDPAVLSQLGEREVPLFQDQTLILPALSLVGLPADETAYEMLYQGYWRHLLASLRHNLTPPPAIPDQNIASLCFPPGGHSLKLFTYDPAAESWQATMPERSFRYLADWAGEEGLILQEYGGELEANDLRLLRWQREQETLLYDGVNRQRLPRPVGWSDSGSLAHLLLYEASTTRADVFYNWLQVDACGPAGCEVLPLSGFTVWAPDGQHTLMIERGQLRLGDESGQTLWELEHGFNPFWLDDETYGYLRYSYSSSRPPRIELITARVGDNETAVRLRSTDLPGDEVEGTPFIDYVRPLPGREQELLVGGPSLGGPGEDYYLYRVDLAASPPLVELLMRFEQRPRGNPELLTPTGYPPINVSPDGRWLLTTTRGPAPGTWTLALASLETAATYTVVTSYPDYHAHFPYYDWTADGEWLLVVDDGFLRLIAPERHYQRLVSHSNEACLFTVWFQ